jgi:signal transduction histidine kinase
MTIKDSVTDIHLVNELASVPTILDVVCRTTGMGFAAIARVTEDRWIACAVKDDINFGLEPGGELDVKSTICDEIRASAKPVMIDDVISDPLYCDHHTPARYGFRSYISMPIFRGDGSFFGTLCAIDPKPAHVSRPEVIGMFRLFADLLGYHLDAQEKLAANEVQIARQMEVERLREQFVAVLGHDLRNPLAAMGAGISLLRRGQSEKAASQTLKLMDASLKRMLELTANVMDFARGRLGDGFTIMASREHALKPILQTVIDEIRSAVPDRQITCELAFDDPVYCDTNRVGQLVSNMLSNAVTHGDVNGPIEIRADTSDQRFTLTVINRGRTIPPEITKKLFEPFHRGGEGGSRAGLGLGLYICAEIARAHGGTIDVVSEDAETAFTFRIPQ